MIARIEWIAESNAKTEAILKAKQEQMAAERRADCWRNAAIVSFALGFAMGAFLYLLGSN